ncbi:MAG: arylsulfatase, partial [Planctomycetia bacterium]
MSQALLGTGPGRRELLQQDNGRSGRFGFRQGKWKLVRLPPGRGGKAARTAGPGDALYDLDADPGESTDVAADHPQVLARLAADLDRITQP